MRRVLHLVDDVTPGGVMRVVDHLQATAPGAGGPRVTHEVARVGRHELRFDPKGADVIASHLALNWRSFIARTRLRARHPTLPMLHVEHSYTQGFTAQNVRHRRRFHAMLRTGFGLFDHVIAVSEAQRGWMLARGLVRAGKISTIRSAVDLAPFAALPAPSGPVRRFGLIGRLHASKGFDVAIRAFLRCPEPQLRLEVFGDGPDRAALRALAKADRRIRFHGHASDPTLPMHSVDAVLMPSRWESYGLVAQEARAAGRAVLAARVDGLCDQTREGVQLVPGHDLDLWARHIRALASRPAGVRARPHPAQSGAYARAWRDLILRHTDPVARVGADPAPLPDPVAM